MAINISRRQQQLLLEWAQAAGANECCGLLLGTDDEVERVELTANVATEPENSFEIDPIALISAEKLARHGGPNIVGYFHSHPNGVARPSKRDAAMAANDGRIWVIVAGDEITAWRPKRVKDGAPALFEPVAIVEG